MSKEKLSFEEQLRQTMEGHEVPYQEGSWEALKAQMGGASAGGSNTATLVAILAAAMFAGLGAWYFYAHEVATSAKDSHLSTLMVDREGRLDFTEKIQAYEDATAGTEPTEGNESAEVDGSSNAQALAESEERAQTTQAGAVDNTIALTDNRNEASTPDRADASEAEATEGASKRNEASIIEFPATDNMPAIPIAISTREACEGATVSFTIDATVVDGNYLWNFGDGSFSNQPNPEHTYHKAGTYDITLSITSNSDGVIRTNTMDQLIVINPKPEADFDWEFVGSKRGQPVVRFNNKSRRASQAQWVIVDSVSEEINPTQLIASKGAHEIELRVSNEFGCEAMTARKVSVNEDYALQAPTRFSPNEDGLFDTFMPKALMTGEHVFTMTIKKGDEIIYETSDPMKPWTGALPDGNMAESGSTFTWEAVVHKRKGDQYYSGNVAVIR